MRSLASILIAGLFSSAVMTASVRRFVEHSVSENREEKEKNEYLHAGSITNKKDPPESRPFCSLLVRLPADHTRWDRTMRAR